MITGPVAAKDALLPDGWAVWPLKKLLSSFELGGNYPNSLTANDYPLMKMGNLGRGRFDLAKIEYVASGTTPIERHRLRRGDVLFNTRNTLDLVGKIAMWREEVECAYFNSNLMRLKFDPEIIVSNEFANLALNSENSISGLRAMATGTTSVAAIYTRDLLALPVVVPPAKEQQAIAAALTDADEVVVGLERAIAKKRLIKQGAMQDLLTARRRLPGFSGEWETIRLGACASLISKGTTPTSIGHSFVEHGINFIKVESLISGRSLDLSKVAAVSEETHSALKRSQLQAGDILISIAGAIGRVGIVDKDILPANTNQALAFVRLHDRSALYPDFVPFALESEEVRAHWDDISVQGAQPNISLQDVRNLILPCPPYDEQQAIAAVLSDMEAEIQTLEARLTKAREVKEGMMQNLLTGRVRLV